MKSKRFDIRKRRAFFMLLAGLLVTMIVLGLAPWTSAEGKEPTPLIPDSSDIYKDRMPTEEEIGQIESPVERYMALESFSADQLLGSDLSTSSTIVDREELPAGSMVEYTIVVRNSGDTQVMTTMVDALPAGFSYVSHERIANVGVLLADPEFTVVGNEVIWKGDIAGGGYVEILIKARISDNVPAGTMITNTAQISGSDQTVSPKSTVKVLEKAEAPDQYLPFVSYPIPPDPPEITNLTATRPDSQNKFQLSWTGGPKATHYIVEQANDPGFSSPIAHDTGLNTFLELQPQPSWKNDFYFRVRSFEGPSAGKWSDTINVVGAYYDEFDDPNSGWDIRRTTHIDHVNFWYEILGEDDWVILEVGSKWDWGIASPLAKAPEPPYVIEYDGKFAQTPNEVSMGIVFGGDYPGEICPDKSTVEGMYQHQLCFNHFYNPHYFWAGEALHLLWYRTDELIWCPECGGSPMKRRGDTIALGQMEDVKNDGWNRHRIEVRDGSIKYFVGRPDSPNLTLQYEYNDTRWIHEPYFGVFAYAGEYTSSVARFEYFSITPLDE